MELVEAVILLLVGMVPGVWTTFVDVYAHGASAFSSHVSVWLLLIMVLATNARYRRQAGIGAAALSLGYIEAYYLSSSFTFAGMGRSAAIPLALLSVVGAVVANVGWAAKRERGALGLALKALVVVATLVACVATHDAISSTDVVCVVIIAYLLVVMRSRKVALERRAAVKIEGQAEQAARGVELMDVKGSRSPAPQRRLEPSSEGRGRSTAHTPAGEGRRSTSHDSSRRARRSSSTGEEASSRRRSNGAAGGSAASRGSRVTHGSETGRSSSRPSSSNGSPSGQRRGTRGAPASRAGADKEQRRGTAARKRTQRPTRRTGGAVPEANRIRNSASDRPRQGSSRSQRSGSSGRRAHRR